jgi:hypothetical protein
MGKPRNRQRQPRVASPFTLLIPRGNRGCYPPGPDADDSDCYQSDADLDDGCYHSGEEILRSLIGPPHPRG